MYQLALILHIFAAVCIIGLVLVQQGKGATMGAAFGSGASQTIFGSRGSGSFLLRVTIGFVVLFFSTSIALNHMAAAAVKAEQQENISMPVIPVAPAQGSQPEQGSAVPPLSPSSIPMAPETQPVKK